MPQAQPTASPFHAGEKAVQRRLGVADDIEPWARKVVRPELTPEHREFFAALPFVVVAARDSAGRPWATLLAGAPGFASSTHPGSLHFNTLPASGDALDGALRPGADVGVLGIELATRRRNRVNGRVRGHTSGAMLLDVDQSFGNCPQYITEREWRSAPPASATPVRTSHRRLTPDLVERIRAADTFFIATGHRAEGADAAFGMDASHRGGAPGFVGVEDDRTLVIPDYAGNNHYNTLGNLEMDPRAGLVFVDFETGGLLQLTGRTEIDWNSERVARTPGARRLIRFTLEDAVALENALPIRWHAPRDATRELRLTEKLRESDDVTSFVFEAMDARPLAEFAAGQHLPISVQLPDRSTPVSRTYSLSNAPGQARYRISVKRESQGEVSRHLHDQLEVGARIQVRDPAGDFALDAGQRPVVLVSAGIGLTPMLSMLGAVVGADRARPAWFVHGARDGRHLPLLSEVQDLAAQSSSIHVHVAQSRPLPDARRGFGFDSEGRVDAELLAQLLDVAEAEFYVCGPVAFMNDIQAGLEGRGVPRERIHTESFGPVG